MDYRSRQRVPSDQISNSKVTLTTNTNTNGNNLPLTTTTNALHQQTSASSTRTTSSSLGGGDQQLDSLQSNSSSQQAMLSNQQHYQQSNYSHINPQQQQRLLGGGGAPNKMQHQQHQQQQHFQQRNIMQQQQNQNKQQQQQRIPSNQQHRLMTPRTSAAAAVAATSTNKHQQAKSASGLLLHHHNSSSGDNMTTSSGEQTIDDLQQLAHGYRNPNNPLSQMQQHASKMHQHNQHTNSSKMSPMYSFGPNERQECLNPLSPRLPVGPSSSSTTTTSSLAATSSAMITTSRPGLSEHANSGSRFLLGVLFTLAEILLFSVLLLWLYWAFQHDDGLSWQNERKQQFNMHAALMILGFIFLNGQAMLIYRSFQCCTKIYTKILHTLLFVVATSAIGFGLCLAYTAQENVGANNKPIMHFYSLHAWIGLSSISLFALQFCFGFVTFLVMLCCEQATSKFRAALLPIHKTFGLIIFSLAISTCLTGLLQTARSRLSSKLGKVDYHELGEAGIVINVIGACLICLAILMPYIIRNLDIKHPHRSHARVHSRASQDRRLRLSEMDMRI